MELRIAAEIDRQDLGPEIRDAIHTSIQTYRDTSFRWNETRTEWSTSAGQEYYTVGTVVGTNTIPTDIQWVQNLKVRVNGESYDVPHRNFWEIDHDRVNSTYQGYPEYWAWHKNAFRLYPIPSAVFAMEMAYVQDLSADSGPTAGEDWYARGELMVRCKAKSLLYAHVRQIMDLTMHQFYETQAEREYRRVKGENDRLQSSGHIQPWGM